MNGKNASFEYVVTTSIAKEIAMLEGNDKGKQARQYFISCEKSLKENRIDFTDPKAILQIAQNWADEQEKRIATENHIKTLQPKVIFADAVAASKTTILIGELAKILKQNGMEIGQNRLFEKGGRSQNLLSSFRQIMYTFSLFNRLGKVGFLIT